jgi:hypothetical protein
MKIRIKIIIIFLLFIAEKGAAQNSDFGIWYGLNGEISVGKKLEIDLSGCFRTFEKAARLEETFIEGGVTYKFNKYLSAAGSYRFTEQAEDSYGFYPRHKIFAGLKATLPAGNFKLSARLMFQYMQKTFIKKQSDEGPDYHGRLKLKANYKIPAFPVNPYVYYELFSPMFDNSTMFIDKERFSAGIELKITRKQALELEYIYQRDFEPKLNNENIVSLNYNFKF